MITMMLAVNLKQFTCIFQLNIPDIWPHCCPCFYWCDTNDKQLQLTAMKCVCFKCHFEFENSEKELNTVCLSHRVSIVTLMMSLFKMNSTKLVWWTFWHAFPTALFGFRSSHMAISTDHSIFLRFFSSSLRVYTSHSIYGLLVKLKLPGKCCQN